MIKLIIFDWDDVFTQGSTQGYYRCYHEAVTGVGIHLPPDEEKRRIDARWGSSHQAELSEVLREHPDLVPQASELYEQHLFGTTFVDSLSIVPGSKELLERLADTYTLALATGVNPRVLKERVMPRFGIPNVFAQILTAYDLDDSAKAKPHPYSAETILRDQKCSPDEAIVVGDATNDVLMARNAGIEPVVVLTGHLDRDGAEALGVRYIIDCVTALEPLLELLNTRA